MYSLTRKIVAARWTRRIFPYSFLLACLGLEMYLAYYHERYLLQDRICVISMIVLFFSLHLLKIRFRGLKLVFFFIFTGIMGLILTVHTGYLLGNGQGFSLENCIHIFNRHMFLEFVKMSPGWSVLLILQVLLFPVIILSSAFLLYWSVRPLPRSKYVRIIGWIVAGTAMMLMFVFFYPAYEIKSFFRAYEYVELNKTVSSATGLKYTPVTDQTVRATAGKNLVFIILESTELNYLDETIFPGLVPNLKKISRESQVFTNVGVNLNAHTTFGGIYSMMHGFYLTDNSIFDERTKRKGGSSLSSFPKILNKAGYKQYFIVGHSGNFAGTEQFMLDQRYDEVWSGIDRAERERGWKSSVRDSAVFEQAWKYYQKAAGENHPFNITVLSLDAHGPDGFYDPKEPAYPRNAGRYQNLFNAMYASDYALGKFLDRIRKSPAAVDTCIVITSDHTAHTFTATRVLLDKKPPRRMLFMVWNSAVSDYQPTIPGRTFDEGPTILDAMGVKHNYTFPLGESLYSSEHNQHRLKWNTKQINALNSYLALKTIRPVFLPEKIFLLEEPYLQIGIGDYRVPMLIENLMVGLPEKEEVFTMDIPDVHVVNAPRTLYTRKLANLTFLRTQFRNYLFLAENNDLTAGYFHVPRQKGYLLGLRINGRKMIKNAEKISELELTKDEVRQLMKGAGK